MHTFHTYFPGIYSVDYFYSLSLILPLSHNMTLCPYILEYSSYKLRYSRHNYHNQKINTYKILLSDLKTLFMF